MGPNHYVCVAIYRFTPDKELEFLVIDYMSANPFSATGKKDIKLTKFVDGMNNGYPDELVEQTRDRKLFEATGLRMTYPREIWKSELGGLSPVRYGFLAHVDNCRGGLRMETLDDGDVVLSVPYWVPEKNLKQPWALFHAHYDILVRACHLLRPLF